MADFAVEATQAGIAALTGLIGLFAGRWSKSGGKDGLSMVSQDSCNKTHAIIHEALDRNEVQHGEFYKGIAELNVFRASSSVGMQALADKVDDLKQDQTHRLTEIGRQIRVLTRVVVRNGGEVVDDTD